MRFPFSFLEKKMTTNQGKFWVFTINNPTEVTLPRQWPNVQYAIWQLEKGEEETPHLQGYVVFKSNQRLAALKKIDATAHWEIRRGSHQQAKDYSSKEDTRQSGPYEIGDEYGVFVTPGTSPADLAYCLYYLCHWQGDPSPPPSPVLWEDHTPCAEAATNSSPKKRKIGD